MTACKDSLSGKKAVSTTLAGVLAVGMVPAVALADQAPADEAANDGIELQALTPAEVFSNGTLSGQFYMGDTAKAANALVYDPDNSVSFVPSKVELNTAGATDVTISANDLKNYEVTYYKADKKGNPTGDAIAAPKDAGKYVVVVEQLKGDYKGGKAKLAFEITAQQISAATAVTLDEDGDVAAKAAGLTYTGVEQEIGYALTDEEGNVKAGDKTLVEGTDYSVKYYKAGSDLTDANLISGAPVDKGDYVAVLTGMGNYAGSTDKKNISVAAFDLKDITAVGDITTKSAAQPAHPTSITVGGKEITEPALLDQIKLTLAGSDKYYDANKAYTFTYGVADKDNKNVVDNREQKTNTVKVYKIADEATFTYAGEAVPETLNIDLSKKESYDEAKWEALNADGDEAKITFSYATKDGKAATKDSLKAAGTYVVTAKVTPDYTTASNANYQLGGEVKMTVTVTNGALNVDAKSTVAYDGKAVDSVEVPYGTSLSVSDFTVTVKDAKGTIVNAKDYKVKLVDADGKDASGTLKAGEYKLVITSDKYELEGTTEVPVTVTAIDMSDVKVKDIVKDGISVGQINMSGYSYVAQNDKKTLSDLTVNAYGEDENKDGVKDDAEYTVSIPTGVTKTWSKYNKDTEEYEKVSASTPLMEGSYKLTLTAAKDEEGNYAFADGNETVLDFTVAKKSECVFGDVAPTEWFFKEVAKAQGNAYVKGIGDTGFYAPYESMSRGQVAIVIMRMAGGDDDLKGQTYDTPFADVASDAYYAKAVQWASDAGIVTGFDGTGKFRPNDPVTREQFATMLARYAKLKGAYTEADASVLADYADAANVSDWSKSYVAWAVENKVMGQNTTVLNPAGEVSRAEVAAMAVRYQPSKLA